MLLKRWHIYKRLAVILTLLLGFTLYLRHQSNNLELFFLNWYYGIELETFKVAHNLNNKIEYVNINQINRILGGNNLNNLKINSKSVICDLFPNNLKGRLQLDLKPLGYEELDIKYEKSNITGGHWKPLNCLARYKVALVVPYRNRDEQLRIFLNHMHPYLQRQLIDYSIYIVEVVCILMNLIE